MDFVMTRSTQCHPIINIKTKFWELAKRFYMVSVQIATSLFAAIACKIISLVHSITPYFIFKRISYGHVSCRYAPSPVPVFFARYFRPFFPSVFWFVSLLEGCLIRLSKPNSSKIVGSVSNSKPILAGRGYIFPFVCFTNFFLGFVWLILAAVPRDIPLLEGTLGNNSCFLPLVPRRLARVWLIFPDKPSAAFASQFVCHNSCYFTSFRAHRNPLRGLVAV